MTKQEQSAPVPGPKRDRTKPAEGVRSGWEWTEASVWTDRMLTALEAGVKGGKWHSLMDKVYKRANLESATRQVVANRGAPGVDHIRVEHFLAQSEANLKYLEEALRTGRYQPQDIKRVWIPKPGSKEQRPLGIPTVRDRVVQAALRNVLEPIFERDFAEQSYGFRPRRGAKDALRRVDGLLQAGYRYVVDADLKSYFDTIDHELLLGRIREKISDGRVLGLIEQFLKQGVLEGLSRWTPEAGSPQGAVLSPLLSNLFLDPLDQKMAERGYEMIRYADDFVIMCKTAQAAQEALALVNTWTQENKLILHPEKTRIVDAQTESFDFLGYSFCGQDRRPRAKSLRKLKDTLRVTTKRTNGQRLSLVIKSLNDTLRGWFEYFKHANRRIFAKLDEWIRMRLRSILRQRAGRRGRGRGWDHRIWPNAFFAEQGLYSLKSAHALACQSSRRT